jgi:hypothetical protein
MQVYIRNFFFDNMFKIKTAQYIQGARVHTKISFWIVKTLSLTGKFLALIIGLVN